MFAERLLEKIETLSPARVAEVEDFIDFLREREERQLAQAVTRASEAAFAQVWDNPQDAAYDNL